MTKEEIYDRLLEAFPGKHVGLYLTFRVDDCGRGTRRKTEIELAEVPGLKRVAGVNLEDAIVRLKREMEPVPEPEINVDVDW